MNLPRRDSQLAATGRRAVRPSPGRRRRCTLLSLLGATALGGCSVPLLPARDQQPIPILWRTYLGPLDSPDEGVRTLPAYLDGRLFVTQGRTVLALDATTGAKLWRSVDGPVIRGSARLLARDGRVFASEYDVVAFEAATGRVLWQRRLDDWPIFPAGTVDDQSVYVASLGVAYALDVATGAQRWAYPINRDWPFEGRTHGATLSGDTVYFSGRKFLGDRGPQVGFVYALHRRTGALIWKWETDERTPGIHGTVGIAGRTLLASSAGSSRVIALDRFTRQELWRSGPDEHGGLSDGVALLGDTMYFGDHARQVFAHEIRTGKMLWRSDKKAPGSLAANQLCGPWVFTTGGGVFIVDRHTGRHVATDLFGAVDMVISGPVVVNNVAYMTGTIAVYAIPCSR